MVVGTPDELLRLLLSLALFIVHIVPACGAAWATAWHGMSCPELMPRHPSPTPRGWLSLDLCWRRSRRPGAPCSWCRRASSGTRTTTCPSTSWPRWGRKCVRTRTFACFTGPLGQMSKVSFPFLSLLSLLWVLKSHETRHSIVAVFVWWKHIST